MIRRFIRDTIFILLIISTITTIISQEAFAIADYIEEMNYEVITHDDGVKEFKSGLASGLKIYPDYFDLSDWNKDSGVYLPKLKRGDFTIEFTNKYCLAEVIAVFFEFQVAKMIANSVSSSTQKALIMGTALATLAAAVGIIYAIAKNVYENVEVCGADWLIWGHKDKNATENFKKYYPERGEFRGSKKYEVLECFKNVSKCYKKCEKSKKNCVLDIDFMKKDGNRKYVNINDKVYRERLYDGEEVRNDDCDDPREEAKYYDVNQGKKPKQLYYMRGFDRGNFACSRFLVEKQYDGDRHDEAYKCCVKYSKKFCLTKKSNNDNFFCDTPGEDVLSKLSGFITGQGKICSHNGIKYRIEPSSQGESGQFCARTWSLCPFNVNIQKGTELVEEFKMTYKTINKRVKIDHNCTGNCKTVLTRSVEIEDECYDKANETYLPCKNKVKNFYQYNRHCSIVEEYYNPFLSIQSYPPYVDKACINFVGSSHNITGYKPYHGYQRIPDIYHTFTSPVVECFVESLKNFLFNRAGHTKCLGSHTMPSETPNMNGECETGYYYKEGDNLTDTLGQFSPTGRLLKILHNLIMLVLVLFVTLYGYNLLMSGGKLTRKDLLVAMLKVAVVVVFSANTWWYEQIFRFTFAVSDNFLSLTAKIGFDDTKDLAGNYVKYDGCYFGDLTSILGRDELDGAPKIAGNNYHLYPAQRRYVAFFDSLDCKLEKYLGVSVGGNVTYLLWFLALNFIWPFAIFFVSFGIFLIIASVVVFFFALEFTLKVAYFFMCPIVAMAVMLFLAPIMIPCILFRKTKSYFDKWLKNLISFALQPMIVFAYVGMALTMIDTYILGDAVYIGTGRDKELICGSLCVSREEKVIIDYTDRLISDLDKEFVSNCGPENDIVNLKGSSVLCLLKKQNSTPVSLLGSLGIFLSALTDIGASDGIMFLRVAFLFFILSRAMVAVAGIAASLTGGQMLPMANLDAIPMMGKMKDLLDALKRLGRKIKKFGLTNKNDDKDDKDKDGADDKGIKGDREGDKGLKGGDSGGDKAVKGGDSGGDKDVKGGSDEYSGGSGGSEE